MGLDIGEALAAQGLDASDVEANREGRVSERQIARQAAVRRWGGRGVWVIAIASVVGCGCVAALPLGIYYAFRFADPAKVRACAVMRIENAEVGAFLPAPFRGVYAINLNGRHYSGFARDLRRTHLGARVNAYIVAEHRIVVALEPIE